MGRFQYALNTQMELLISSPQEVQSLLLVYEFSHGRLQRKPDYNLPLGSMLKSKHFLPIGFTWTCAFLVF